MAETGKVELDLEEFKIKDEKVSIKEEILPSPTAVEDTCYVDIDIKGVQDVDNSKPVFDPDFHTELIIKDEFEDCNLGENMDDRFDDFKSEPKRNKKRKVEYACKECEYVATQAGNLKTHIENKHKGIRYPCS
ncbi:uncharacterized protein LOC111717500 [Eurytemora carolleeae]|uniref:uncharacterized protein LOC111717500 n=1 Tax=Eurytemora carolleeae TaxID=1294199 RepID=UPI000C77999A|nr:uncharacterized protein LOC111717500 [Eurytemora carolleeae]|eukprot:XP_023348762.1 uncharacterized protein LOC111717500 [Eurytemora affinis]